MSEAMYKLKPIIQSVQIDYPTCMYQMKTLQSNKMSGTSQNDAVRKLPEMEALELRQQNILQQLDELRKQIQMMNKDLKVCNKPAQHPGISTASTQTEVKPVQSGYLQDVVINVNPNFIPYSLLAVKHLWVNRLQLNFLTFVHSSVSEISKEAQNFAVELLKDIKTDHDLPSLKISLIWKNIGANAELNCSAIMYVPIYGEVNILRYLARIGPNEFNYESNTRVNEIDIILDTCYQIVNETNSKPRQNYLRVLSSRLGKYLFFGGDSVSIADFAVYSIFKQNLFVAKDLSQNLNKFVQNVTQALQY